MWLSLLLVACAPELAPGTCEAPPDDRLFGLPSANTGLDDDACGPGCGCGPDAFEPPPYDEEEVAALLRWTLLDPPTPLDADPYDDPAGVPERAGVCAALVADPSARTYRLDTFEDAEAADAAGAVITHDGACGLCSSLADLAVYVANPDLTDPVRGCAISGALGGEEGHRACLQDIGFTEGCAEIWRFNTVHTQEECIDVCLALLDAPHHLVDGSLNACLQCDEDQSGDVFKAVAGRTRRNSGLPSALCRPCGSVYPVVHDW